MNLWECLWSWRSFSRSIERSHHHHLHLHREAFPPPPPNRKSTNVTVKEADYKLQELYFENLCCCLTLPCRKQGVMRMLWGCLTTFKKVDTYYFCQINSWTPRLVALLPHLHHKASEHVQSFAAPQFLAGINPEPGGAF